MSLSQPSLPATSRSAPKEWVDIRVIPITEQTAQCLTGKPRETIIENVDEFYLENLG